MLLHQDHSPAAPHRGAGGRAPGACGWIDQIVEADGGKVIELAPLAFDPSTAELHVRLGGLELPEGVLAPQDPAPEMESPASPAGFRSLATLWAERGDLQREIDNLRVAVEHMPHGLCMFDKQGRLIMSNPQYAKMYGLAEADILPGMPLEEIIERRIARGMVPEGGAQDYMRRCLRQVRSRSSETTFMELSDGRTIAATYRPLATGGWVATHEDVTERVELHSVLERMAYEDTLTKLPNSARMQQRLQRALDRGEKVAVIYVDLDRFKEVNDTFGHTRGNRLLEETGRRLVRCARNDDLVSRLGGDEFAILSRSADPADAAATAERVLAAFAEPFQSSGSSIQLGASIGVALSEGSCTAEQLTANAALALYKAKALGRQRFCMFELGMFTEVRDRRELLADLRHALAEGQLDVAYQPIVRGDSGQAVSFEALLRWNHPVRGPVSPAEFVPIAEEEGLMGPIGQWVLRQACKECAAWPDPIGVTVNLCATEFRSADIVDVIVGALEAAGLRPDRLSIEITETSLLHTDPKTLDVLNGLRALGIDIAMDDFGTGYSSLSYLNNFPFSKVKIDRCFVRNSETSESCRRMLEAILTMTKALEIPSVVEGVGTPGQLAAVRRLGCSEIQGFFFGRPMPRTEVRRWLAQRAEGPGAQPAAALAPAMA